jgi:hypothetical protein
MTGNRLREILHLLSWSHSVISEKVDWDTRTIRRWASGQNEIPDDVAAWLEGLAAAHGTPPRRKPKAVEGFSR